MALTCDDVVEDLEKVYEQMAVDGLKVGLVGYIGGTPESIGRFFSERFCCELINLPSTGMEGNYRVAIKLANIVYDYFPECFRIPVSIVYKSIRKSRKTIFPENFKFNGLLYKGDDLPILLVDDNSFTGRTFEFWKHKIEENAQRAVYTFSITRTGSYKPDYFCIDGWRSFEWRPVGV